MCRSSKHNRANLGGTRNWFLSKRNVKLVSYSPPTRRRHGFFERRDFIHPPQALACAQVSVELLLSHHNDQATFPQEWIHALHERLTRPTPELQRSEDFCSRKKRLIMRRIISISGSELSGRAPSSSSFSCRMSIGLKPAK